MFPGHKRRGSLQMLLEKWSTSYLTSTMLKRHTAQLKTTAPNSLQSIAPRCSSSGCAPGRLSRAALPSTRPGPARTGGCALPALTFPSIPGHSRDASGLGTTQSAPSSHATSAHKPHCVNEPGTDAEQTKKLGFTSSGQTVYC